MNTDEKSPKSTSLRTSAENQMVDIVRGEIYIIYWLTVVGLKYIEIKTRQNLYRTLYMYQPDSSISSETPLNISFGLPWIFFSFSVPF